MSIEESRAKYSRWTTSLDRDDYHLNQHISEIIAEFSRLEEDLLTADEKSLFLNTYLTQFLTVILDKRFFNSIRADYSFILDFLHCILPIMLKNLSKNFPGLIDSLLLVLNYDKNLYNKNYCTISYFTERELLEASEKRYNKTQEFYYQNSGKFLNVLFKLILNHFSNIEGFQHISSYIETCKDLDQICNIIKTAVFLDDVMPSIPWRRCAKPIFFKSLTSLLCFNEDDWKSVQKSDVKNFFAEIRKFLGKLNDKEKYAEKMERCELEVYHKLLIYGNLEKKIFAVSELANKISQAKNFDENNEKRSKGIMVYSSDCREASKWLTSKEYISWLDSNNYLALLFEQSHHEILKRSSDILKFLYQNSKFSQAHITELWETTFEKHEAEREALTGLLQDLIAVMDSDDLKYLYDKIQFIPFHLIDNQILQIVKSFAKLGNFHWPSAKKLPENAENTREIVIPEPESSSQPDEISKEKFDTTAVLYYLWTLWGEPAGLPREISVQAGDILKEALLYNYRTERVKFIEQCIENINSNTFVLKSCELIKALIESFPSGNINFYDTATKNALVKTLNEKNKFVSILIKNLILFKKISLDLAYQEIGDEIPDQNNYEPLFSTIRVSKESSLCFFDELRSRFDFLNYVYSINQEFLTEKYLKNLYECFVVNTVSEKESEVLFVWLGTFVTSWTFKDIFSSSLKLFVFKDILLNIDPESYTVSVFGCFEKYFVAINKEYSLVKQIYFDENVEVFDIKLIGMENLWEIMVNTLNERVFASASQFLKRLYKGIRDCTVEIQEDFIKTCMFFISKYPVTEPSDNSVTRVQRCLTLILEFINEFENFSSKDSEKELNVTVKNQCKSLEHSKEFTVPLKATMTWVQARDIISNLIEVKEKLSFLLRGKFLGKKDEQKTLEDLGIDSTVKICVSEDFDEDIEMGNMAPAPTEEQTGNIQYLKGIFESLDEPLLKLALEKCDFNCEDAVMFLLDETNQDRLRSQISANSVPSGPKESYKLGSMISNTGEYFSMIFNLFSFKSYRLDEKIWEVINKIPVSEAAYNNIYNIQGWEDWSQLFDKTSMQKLFYALQIVEKILSGDSESWKEKFFETGGFYHLYEVLINYKENGLSRFGNSEVKVTESLLKVVPVFLSIDSISETVWILINPSTLLSCVIEIIESCSNYYYTMGIVIARAIDFLVILLRHDPGLLSEISSKSIFDYLISNVLLNSYHQAIRESIVNAVSLIINSHKQTDDQQEGPLFHFWKIISECLPKEKNENCDEFFKLASLVLDRFDGISEEFIDSCMNFINNREIIENPQDSAQDKVAAGYFNLLKISLKKFPKKCTQELSESLFKALFDLDCNNLTGPKALPRFKHHATRRNIYETLQVASAGQNSEFLLTLLSQNHSQPVTSAFLSRDQELKLKSQSGFVGLRNFGSTCYLNSLIQQLFMIESFKNKILATPVVSNPDNILYQLKTMFINLIYSEKECYEPLGFCSSFKWYEGEPINPRIQQDADEFFNLLLDKIENVLKETESPDACKKLIGGSIVHLIESCEESYPYFSETEEHFFRISLDVKNKRNLAEALDLFIKADMLEGDNKYLCEKYNTKITAKKRCLISELKDTIFIHLKRFEFDYNTMQRIKVNDYCEFPVNINFKQWSKVQEKPDEYFEFELAGVLLHSGVADSGHYTSIIKDRKSQNWFRFDDRHVEKYFIDNLKSDCFGGESGSIWEGSSSYYSQTKNAYMLIYERKGFKDESDVNMTDSGFAEIYQNVKEENLSFFKDLLLLDLNYFEFLKDFVREFPFEPNDVYQQEYSNTEDIQELIKITAFVQEDQKRAFLSRYQLTNTEEYRKFTARPLENLEPVDSSFKLIKLVTLYVYEAFIKTKKIEIFNQWMGFTQDLFLKHIRCSLWFISFITEKPDIITEVLIECRDFETREKFSVFLSSVLAYVLKAESPVLLNYIQVVNLNYLPFPSNYPWFNLFTSVFQAVFSRFIHFYVKVYLKEFRKHNLSIINYLQILNIISSSNESLLPLLVHLECIPEILSVLTTSDKPINIVESQAVFSFISPLVKICSTYGMRNSGNFPYPTLMALDSTTESFLTELKTRIQLIAHFRTEPVELIILHVCWENFKTSKDFIEEFSNSIFNYKTEPNLSLNYLKIIEKILKLKDSAQPLRVKEFVSGDLIRNFYSSFRTNFFDQLKKLKDTHAGFVMNVVIWWAELMNDEVVQKVTQELSDSFRWIAYENLEQGFQTIDLFGKGEMLDYAYKESVKVFMRYLDSSEESSIEVEIRPQNMEDKPGENEMDTDEN